jgi:hypothetical protein
MSARSTSAFVSLRSVPLRVGTRRDIASSSIGLSPSGSSAAGAALAFRGGGLRRRVAVLRVALRAIEHLPSHDALNDTSIFST